LHVILAVAHLKDKVISYFSDARNSELSRFLTPSILCTYAREIRFTH